MVYLYNGILHCIQKGTTVTSNNMVVSNVKRKKPDTKNIGCIKFKTGKANLGDTDWGEKGRREDLWGGDMFSILIWVMLIQCAHL